MLGVSRRTAVAAAALAGAALTGVSGAVASPRAVAAPCPHLYVLGLAGTWAQGPGLLGAVTDGLSAKVDYVGYARSAFPFVEKRNYGASKAQGVNNARGLALQMVRRCPGTKVALTGYSQGADAAGDLASEVGTGLSPLRPENIAGVVLLADPRRSARDQLVGPRLNGQGSGGPRFNGFGRVSHKVYTICEPGDMYCNVPRDYYITRIVGFLAEVSNPNPQQILAYGGEAAAILGELLTVGGPGAIVGELSNAKARQQITSFWQFLRSGAHGRYTTFQVKPGVTATQWAHNYLNRL
ncbi:MAG: cutinase family protein [Gordonia sp. (in: high G+C Gram-positive bacteria)]|uniref:cutinase family protein n=1 Tax=Gordonia sp. (in: high G+C Gram-positive bacteria) TaxID=84139 RepID=UPI0039E60B98